ncbi:Inner membrane protein PPF-1 chloroplastic [Bienertia sinuspersici]
MAKTLVSSSPFIGTLLPLKYGLYSLPQQSKLVRTTVKFSFHQIPPISSIENSIDLNAVFTKAESLLYTLADAAATANPDASGATAQKNGGWFGFISDAMEVVLKLNT